MFLRFWLAAVFAGLSVTSLLAQDVSAVNGSETFINAAERWGLWAASTLVLTGAAMFMMHSLMKFIMTELVKLIRDNQKCIVANTEALKNAPCGKDQGTNR